jgi:hypothetical protein
MLVILNETVPVLLRVTVFAALVVPTTCVPKDKLLGDRLAVWATAATGAVMRQRIHVTARRRALLIFGVSVPSSQYRSTGKEKLGGANFLLF